MKNKEHFAIVGMMLIVLALGVHLNLFESLGISTLQITNQTATNETAVNQTAVNATASQNLTRGVFGLINDYWLLFFSLGSLLVFHSIGIFDGILGSSHHYDYPSYTPSYHASGSLPATEQEDDDDEEEDSPEAKSMQGVAVEILKCPHCGGYLTFGDSTVTKCGYCGNEVRRISK